MNYQVSQELIENFCDKKIIKYKLWVYFNSDMPEVYFEQKPNTTEIYFEFYNLSLFYWKKLEKECIEEYNEQFYFNNQKLRIFMIKYMLHSTNVPGAFIEKNKSGSLTEESFNSIISIHPRILRCLFDIVEFLPKQLDKNEEKQLEKQCSILFGQGNPVSNPNPWVIIYCNLVAFWEKFGMNYEDIMKLPYETFIMLKKIMELDNDFKSKSLQSSSKTSGGKKKVGF